MLAGILGLLGFSGCGNNTGSLAEYGVPHADFTVKGKVVDKGTKNPVQGVRVQLSNHQEHETASSTTDAQGDYELTKTDFPGEELTLRVDDMDGAQNGSYASESTPIDFDGATPVGASGWYKGEYTVTQDVELTEAAE